MHAVEEFTIQASEKGLRTLWFAIKILEESEVHQFHFELERAEQILTQKEERLEKIYSALETDLTLLGATAVEDRLQENVPEVIHDF
jgi:phospholipid-transporting ATPase